MNFERIPQVKNAPPSNAPLADGFLQRKRTYGKRTFGGGGCTECSNNEMLNKQLQTKLRIGESNDKYEQEADRFAERVMRMPKPKNSDANGYLFSKTIVQRRVSDKQRVASEAPSVCHDVLRSPGQPLDQAVRDFMEPRFGYDFSHVRVHHDSKAEESANAVRAKAYTVGQDIVFGVGQFTPGSTAGNRLMAHELTHVVQQSVGGQEEIQRDLAIEPPRPAAVGRVLTPAQMAAAIAFNNRVLGSIANSVDIIQLIRDVIGVSPLPAVVDEDFVNGVIQWQANFGLTQDGQLGPATARPLFREIGAEGVGRAVVSSRPQYTPAGPINVPRAGARRAPFTMSTEFESDPKKGIFPSCGEVRQEIQWDAAFAASSVGVGLGGLPHGGFPAGHPAGRWIEDQNATNSLRYGYRDRFDRGAGNQYLDSAGRQNQAFGHIFSGSDNPGGVPWLRGSWSFRLGAYDVCNGNRFLRYSPTLVVNWL